MFPDRKSQENQDADRIVSIRVSLVLTDIVRISRTVLKPFDIFREVFFIELSLQGKKGLKENKSIEPL
jgi:hypothetical protein